MSDHPTTKTRVRPVTTVLDVLRTTIEYDGFDAALFSLETVAADLGYGDIRALPGAVAWIERLREHGKRIGLLATGERAGDALEIAGIGALFDEVTIGSDSAATVLAAIEALAATPERIVVVSGTATGVAAARAAAAGVVIAVARGASSPEELRRAGAHTVVADLQELLRTVT